MAFLETLRLELQHHSQVNNVDADNLHEHTPVHGRFDENTGEELDPFLLAKGRAKEYDKLVSREVYEAVPRWMANQDKRVGTDGHGILDAVAPNEHPRDTLVWHVLEELAL